AASVSADHLRLRTEPIGYSWRACPRLLRSRVLWDVHSKDHAVMRPQHQETLTTVVVVDHSGGLHSSAYSYRSARVAGGRVELEPYPGCPAEVRWRRAEVSPV